MFHPTFQSIAHDESTAVRCIELVERYAKHFMRIGGGGLSESNMNFGKRLTPAQRGRIQADLRKLGDGAQYRIAKRHGVSQGTVSKIRQKMTALA